MSITVKGSVQVRRILHPAGASARALRVRKTGRGHLRPGEVEFSDCCFLDGHGTCLTPSRSVVAAFVPDA